MSSKNDDILNVRDIMYEFDEPESDELAREEELSDEDLAITAENVDAFADDSVRRKPEYLLERPDRRLRII